MRFYWDLAMNIGILALMANFLTKLKLFQGLIMGRQSSFSKKIFLAGLFSLICIFSTFTGVHLDNVIINTRVIGALAAGILGGPLVGTLTGIIGGLHRYFYDPTSLTAVACSLSTMLAGLMGAFLSPYFLRGNSNLRQVALLAATAEFLHMLLILFISQPYALAQETVRTIALPMILVNSVGMMIFMSSIKDSFDGKDVAAEAKLRTGLSVADRCLPYFRSGLSDPEKMKLAAREILGSTFFRAVMILDAKGLLAKEQTEARLCLEPEEEFLTIARQAMEQGQTISIDTVDFSHPLVGLVKNYTIYAAPLMQNNQPEGCLLVLAPRNWLRQGTDRSMVSGLANLLSTQLELSEMDYQKRLRQKAEYQALQSQINPHFLYNTLNTLACICRENPPKARDLLFTMATYYRQTLDSSTHLISLDKELQQVRNYLELEQARFEDKLTVEFITEPDLNLMVPPLILQPLVENAIKYGVDDRGNRRIRIHVADEGTQYSFSVQDQGPGFDPKILGMLADERLDHLEVVRSQRTHVGLHNVRKRIKSIYGCKGQLLINSSARGSLVKLCIPKLESLEHKEVAGL